ncbi:MAG: ROK family protein [cyanobacterium endosymbiont of Rhopalodia musculus]|uniref:ROK family protein n=1 Tax=cyanobacterium endosymbiont of Epithemia clementina EcSB TaxID=3034674 RepID=UPI00248095CC|nr:ROK family protein [cyanobacterium endosymbiont of Epithemia clementina EcSB]WGT67232.1 ROK family protein [cyanobacterium endosymbiont of Epithemia clementina EcSB]
MEQQSVIGIDLGGTAIKLGQFLRDGTCLKSLTIATPQPSTPKKVLRTMVEAIKQLRFCETCHALGVGTPGPADAQGRIAKVAINLSGWQNIPLADWLETETGLPTTIANDANCAGLGETWLGAGKNFKNLILLTLGTGVGGAIILDGHLFTGHLGAAGELGLITLNFNGPLCKSGNQGSLEQYASVQAIRRMAQKEPIELGQLAAKGNREALKFWKDYGRLLGAGLANLIYILTPEAIVIGGGVSASTPYFFPATLLEIKRRVLPSYREGLQLISAELGNQAGMIGAAKLAWKKVDELTS